MSSLVYCLFLLWNGVSLCNPACPVVYSVYQTSLELTESFLFLSGVWGLKVMPQCLAVILNEVRIGASYSSRHSAGFGIMHATFLGMWDCCCCFPILIMLDARHKGNKGAKAMHSAFNSKSFNSSRLPPNFRVFVQSPLILHFFRSTCASLPSSSSITLGTNFLGF